MQLKKENLLGFSNGRDQKNDAMIGRKGGGGGRKPKRWRWWWC